MTSNKSIFYEQQLFAIKIADIYTPENRKKILNPIKKGKTFLPSLETIFTKDIVIENDLENKNLKKTKYYNNTSYTSYNRSFGTNEYYDEYYDDEGYNNEYENEYYYDSYENNKNEELDSGVYRSYSDSFYSKPTSVSGKINSVEISKTSSNSNLSTHTSNNLIQTNISPVKPKTTLEKNDPTPINPVNSLLNSTENINKSSYESPEKESDKVKFNRKELYRKRDCSRFNFAASETKERNIDDNDKINIPEYINELILKKVSKITFDKIFKYSKSIDDSESILKKNKESHDNWAQFLLSCQDKREENMI